MPCSPDPISPHSDAARVACVGVTHPRPTGTAPRRAPGMGRGVRPGPTRHTPHDVAVREEAPEEDEGHEHQRGNGQRDGGRGGRRGDAQARGQSAVGELQGTQNGGGATRVRGGKGKHAVARPHGGVRANGPVTVWGWGGGGRERPCIVAQAGKRRNSHRSEEEDKKRGNRAFK